MNQSQVCVETDWNKEILDLLHHIIMLSRSMLAAARQQDWDSVVNLQNQRQRLLMQYFCCQVSEQMAAYVSQLVQEVHTIHREIAILNNRGESLPTP